MKVPNPIGNYVLVERTQSESVGLIEIPDRYRKHVMSTAKVLGIGHKCGYQIDQNNTVLILNVPEGKELWKHPDNKNIEIIKESDIFAIVRGKTCIPIGNTVLLRRHTDDVVSKSGLVFPDRASTQTLYCDFICLGMASKPFKTGGIDKLRFGDVIKLTKWNESHIEVMLNNEYCLIVNEQYLEMKIE